MLIRKAKPDDSAIIAPLLLSAMREIVFDFIGENSEEKALMFLEGLIRIRNNQYSYENCFVGETDGKIIVAACVYDGAELKTLRKTVADEIRRTFHKDFNPEDETESGEYYIDCVGVSAEEQGQGRGTEIFNFLIDEYVVKSDKTLGLLVEKANPRAKKLYLKMGFEVTDEKTLAGKQMEHLQLRKK